MTCNCLKYLPLTLDRKALQGRIRESPEILKSLAPAAHHEERGLTLFTCRACGQYWQDGFEWSLKHAQYLYQVPETGIDTWLADPYAQPGAMMTYSALMTAFYNQNTFEETSSKCSTPGCESRAVKFSRFCVSHHIESLQRAKRLPAPPPGRLFPPYYVASSDRREEQP